MTVEIAFGVPQAMRADAARLYWQAFGGKLGTVMGPERRALQFLDRAMRGDHAFVAIEDGRLVGMVGFKSPQGSFAGGAMGDLTAVYGWFGATWRAALLDLLNREVDNERFLLDGICVAAGARSRGIGTLLLGAIETEAVRRGYGSVRLDVVGENLRARALYERQGFVVVRRARLGLLRHVFGFASSLTMVKPVGAKAAGGRGAGGCPTGASQT